MGPAKARTLCNQQCALARNVENQTTQEFYNNYLNRLREKQILLYDKHRNLSFKAVLQQKQMQLLKDMKQCISEQQLQRNKAPQLPSFLYVQLKENQSAVVEKTMFIPNLSEASRKVIKCNKVSYLRRIIQQFHTFKQQNVQKAIVIEQLNKIKLSIMQNADQRVITRFCQQEKQYYITLLGQQFYAYIICIKWQLFQFYNIGSIATNPIYTILRYVENAIEHQKYLLVRKKQQQLLLQQLKG